MKTAFVDSDSYPGMAGIEETPLELVLGELDMPISWHAPEGVLPTYVPTAADGPSPFQPVRTNAASTLESEDLAFLDACRGRLAEQMEEES